ncbi:MAG TPA: alpha-hydroxy acid oxidase [Bauldia sp.]|nr:alpha-hydroxy acid oxidase [Bauldia sp.]
MRAATLKRRGYSIAALREIARGRLPRAVFDYADGGAEDEWTLRRSESAFDDIEFLPRPLNGPGEIDMSVTVFGRKLGLPVIIAPTGLAGLYWPDGEFAAARAAAAAGTGIVVSHASVPTMEEIAATGASPRWMQIFIFRDRGLSLEFASRAAAAGYDALVVTVDNQIIGKRERDLRNGFTNPPRWGAVEIAAMAIRAPWLWQMRRHIPKLTFGNYRRPGENGKLATMAGRVGGMLDTGMSWKDIDMLRRAWKGPFLIKGILHPDDARIALDCGVDGVIVSTHGGRQLESTPATIDALPAVVEAVGDRMTVLLDGGIRRGGDVVKALALGARAVLIGRAYLWGLSVAGEAGVTRVFEIFSDEIYRVMALLGIARTADLGRHVLFQRPRY